MRFQEAIKSLRQSQFLSQEAFAKELGISFTTVNRWENGKAKPTYKTMKLINDYCKKLGIEFDINAALTTDNEGVSTDEKRTIAL